MIDGTVRITIYTPTQFLNELYIPEWYTSKVVKNSAYTFDSNKRENYRKNRNYFLTQNFSITPKDLNMVMLINALIIGGYITAAGIFCSYVFGTSKN